MTTGGPGSDRLPVALPAFRFLCLLAILAGALATPGYAPFDLPLLTIASTALLIRLLHGTTPARGFVIGYFYGIGLFGTGVNWVHVSINLFGGVNLIGAIALTLLFIAFIALFTALAGWLAARLSRSDRPLLSMLVVIPCAWLLIEWCRSWWLTGFPWLSLGYSQTDTLLAGYAPIAGVHGISLVVLIIAGALAVMSTGPKRQQLLRMTALIAVLCLAGWLGGKLAWTRAAGPARDVAIVQGAIPQALKWRPEMRQASIDIYSRLTSGHMQADLVVWPEAAIPALYHQVPGLVAALDDRFTRAQSWLLTGIPSRDPTTGRYFNSIMLLGQTPGFYHKRHLVPFGEYLPLEFLLGGIVRALGISLADFSPGPDVTPVLEIPGLHLGVSICYEDAFGPEILDALPEAHVLVNISNDAWFGDSAAPHQHLQIARMRTLETGRQMIRATNTGISAFIDRDGSLLAQLPQFQPASLQYAVTPYAGLTPYARFGNYPVVGLALLGLLAAGLRSRQGHPI